MVGGIESISYVPIEHLGVSEFSLGSIFCGED